MKKLFIWSLLVCGITLVASDAKRARCDSPSLLDDGEINLEWLKDQCLELLNNIRTVGYTRYTEEDIDAVRTIEDAGALAEKLDLAYVEALKKYRLKKSKPKKKLTWKAKNKEDLEAIRVIPLRESLYMVDDLSDSDHYTIQYGSCALERCYYMTGKEVDYNNQERLNGLRAAREKGVRYDPADITEELEAEKRRANAQNKSPRSSQEIIFECEEDLLVD